MSAKLSNKQKAYLAQLAREAFARQCAEASREEGAVLEGGIFVNAFLNDFEEWRHEQVARACDKLGLRCCTQDDYGAVKGHFLAMLGREGQALKAMVRGDGNPKRVADYKLNEALREAGLARGYAEAICRNMFGVGLAEAGVKQVWKVFYTVRNRMKARKPVSQKASGGEET